MSGEDWRGHGRAWWFSLTLARVAFDTLQVIGAGSLLAAPMWGVIFFDLPWWVLFAYPAMLLVSHAWIKSGSLHAEFAERGRKA